MKVTLVGTSCTWYSRNNTSFILDDKMLFDVSSGNYKEIIKSIDIFDLSAIFISHFHADHIGDLPVITTRFIREFKRRGRTEKLRIYAPKGIVDWIMGYYELFFGAEDERDIQLLQQNIDFIEVSDNFEFDECGYHVKAMKMLHGVMDCYGYMFTDSSGKVISFSADTSICDNLLKMLENSNYAFVDMAGVTENNCHLHVDGFVELAKAYNTCTMIPVHVSDQAREMAKNYNLKCYDDGDVLNI